MEFKNPADNEGQYGDFGRFLKQTYRIPETFEGDERPEYLRRTDTKYARTPVQYLAERGISNRLFDSIIACLPEGAILAGGFMTSVMGENKDAKDIDLFFTSEKAFRDTVKRLMDNTEIPDYLEQEHWAFKDYKPDESTSKALVDEVKQEGLTQEQALGLKNVRFFKFVHPNRPPIQLIKLVWYDDAEHVIDSFDLTIAQYAFDPKTSEIVFNPVSTLDLVRKRLVLHRMQFPASTLRRLVKYTNKGYYACPGSLVKISEAIAQTYTEGQEKDVYLD